MLVEKFGVVAIPVTADGRILAVWDKRKENGHKKEKLGWDVKGVRQEVKDSLQFPGGVNEENNEIKAIRREIGEETEISVSEDEIVPMGVSTMLDHERYGNADLYGVSIYLWMIDGESERKLIEDGAVEVGNDLNFLRRRDQIIAQLFQTRERETVLA